MSLYEKLTIWLQITITKYVLNILYIGVPETPIFLDDQELNGGIDTLGISLK